MGTRVLLFTGKGGVGKTSVAAASGVRAAASGLRTLVLSTDPAHSLADAFDVPLGTGPTVVGDRLEAAQIEAHDRLETHWGDVQAYLAALLRWGGVGEVEAEELALLPGLEEIFSLVDLRTHVDAGRHDLLIVDCAPTAETLRLLSLPDALGWYIERVFPIERKVARVVRPMLGRVTTMPLPTDGLHGSVERLYGNLAAVRDILTDPDTATVRLVVNAEKMVIAEARRTYTYLSLFGYHTDAVVVNRLLPDAVADPWFDRWKELQAEHLAVIRDGFAGLDPLAESNRDRRHVAVHYSDSIGVGAHREARRLYLTLLQVAQNLAAFALDLLFFPTDQGNDIPHDVERWDARISGAGHRL
jgi:arsenite/tail-anchored protein-transporting ATPase